MANGLTIREDVDSLTAPGLAALQGAYSSMMPIADNRGWNYWAGLHGIPNWYCWHGVNTMAGVQARLFLPWHRAYLINFEHNARDQNADFNLSWWDWTSAASQANGVPVAFSTVPTDGTVNPLLSGPINQPSANPPIVRQTTRQPGAPADLPQPADVSALMNLTSFDDFTDQLENIHNNIHAWTGGLTGDMSMVATAAFDPIFYSHHTMIDRVWYLWQVANGINNIPSAYLSMVLQPFTLTVADVLDINKLGYDYASTNITVA